LDIVPGQLGVKVLSVVLAFLLWIHVVTNKDYDYNVTLPLQITEIQEGLMLASNVPTEAEIKVRGTGKQLARFLLDVDSVTIDASSYSNGIYLVEPTPGDIHIDMINGTEILEVVEPKKMRLIFEERMEKRVPVLADIKTETALGYIKEGELRVAPDSITVSGPKRFVRKLTSLHTEELNFSDLTNSLNETVKIDFPDSAFLTLSDSNATIEQTVIRLQERTYDGIPLKVTDTAGRTGYSILPDSIAATIEGKTEVLDSIDVGMFRASVSLTIAKPGSTFVSPTVSIPPGVRLIDIRPKEILIRIPRP